MLLKDILTSSSVVSTTVYRFVKFKYLPVAQRLIDQLRNPNSEINAAVGAPDPTDGGHDNVAIWCLDQRTLHENIRRILIKFCLPSPTVHWYILSI